MISADSRLYFEVMSGAQLDNSLGIRWLCIKDFIKRCSLLPFFLMGKLLKTFFRFVGVLISLSLVILSLGVFEGPRLYVQTRVIFFAKDLVDWFLLPFAVVVRVLRFVLALSVHPKYYFNAYP